jgi:tetratricopeptide (TPR) repeat protein
MTYRFLPQVALICLAGLQMLCIAQTCVLAQQRDSTNVFDLLDQAAQGDNSKDMLMCEKVFYSGLCDQWLKGYVAGKTAEADQTWSKIMSQLKESPSCYILVRKLYHRLDTEAPDNATNDSKWGILAYTNQVLGATEKALGRNHRFVSDILAFKATHYDSIKDYKTALPLRQRELDVGIKSMGPEAEMTGFCMVDMSFELAELGRYEEARQLALRALKLAQTHKYARLLPAAQKLDNQLRLVMQRQGARAH